jgi:nitroimidazol reductase NimA-like FMN-containing flavoprotein (pyridoxamine 5'-phosphate oxidase superfamily)
MSVFTTAEIAHLNSRVLCRLATVGADGQPQVVPVSFRYIGSSAHRRLVTSVCSTWRAS